MQSSDLRDVYRLSRDVYHPLRDVYHPLRDVYHPLRDVYHPLRDVYHPLRDVFPLILSRLKPREILNWFSINKYHHSLCTNDFWRALIIARWGDLEDKLAPYLEYQERYKNDILLLFDSVQIRNDLNAIRELIRRGINVNLQTTHGTTALHLACFYGNLEIVQGLISAGANLNIQDKYGITPLHYASDTYGIKIVCELIKAGADINLRDNFGKTALDYAKHNANFWVSVGPEVIQQLISAGAS